MAETKTNQNKPNIEEVLSLLRNSHAELIRKSRISSVLTTVGFILFGISVLILLDSAVFYSAYVKTGTASVILLLAVFTGFIVLRKSKPVNFKQYCHSLLQSTGKKNVISAVDLYLDSNQKNSKFYRAAIEKNISDLNTHEFSNDINSYTSSTATQKVYRTAGTFATITSLFFLITAFSLPESSQRALTFWQTYSKPNPYTFTVIPGDTTIEHGSSIQAGIQFDGSPEPGRIIFSFKTDVEEEYRNRPLRKDQDGLFLSEPVELTNDISYHIEMDGFKSETFRVGVQLQPRFDELVVLVNPPSYTGLAGREIEYPYTDINFYKGSEIEIRGHVNKPVHTAEIQLAGNWQNMAAETGDQNRNFAFNFTPAGSDTVIFNLVDTDGLQNRNRFRTILNEREDQYPVVNIQEPTGTVLETDPQNLAIFYQATDDFGLTRSELRWDLHRAFVDEPISGVQELQRPRNGRTETHNWELDELQLRPRDEVTFRIRVWDNDQVSGYKWSESQSVVLKVPSLADYFEDLDDREREVQGELDQISDRFRSMEQEYQEFLERLRQNPDGGFEEERIMEEIRERQQQIDEAVKQMNEKFENIRSEMQQNDRTSEETRQAYRELQQLMNELDDPALREAMEQMQKALESMSPQEIERALENMDFNEQVYRERLERTVELFKRLKMNSDLDKLASQYEDLSQRTSPQPGQSTDQLDNELESVQDDMNTLDQQLEELDSNPPKRSEETLRNLKQESQRNLEQLKNQLEQLRQENATQEQQDNPSEEIQQQQQQLSRQLQQEAEKFRSSIQQMSGQQLNVNILALQRALYTLLDLSYMQEYITKTASETRNRNQGFVDLARSQNNVSNQFSLVADTLFQISSEIPGVPNEVNRKKAEIERTITRSIDEMVERNQRGSTVTTRESLAGLNDLTSMIASLVDRLMDQQSGGGGAGGMSMQQMVEQMQQMSGDQMQLNQQLQDLINDIQGDRLSREESERLDQLAKQQNEIRRQMRELQQRGALEPGDRALSELERMVEEMEESINDMRGGMTDPLMVQRQQNILSRMLETEQSLQQRGETEEREGATITGYDRTLPPEMTLEELQQEIRSRLQDPNYTRFSEEYQRLIERYFEQLRRFEDRPVRQ